MAEKDKDLLDTLRKMIEWFDGYAACHNADPFKIERLVSKKKEEDEIVRAWSQIRSDVSDIISLPDSSKEIVKAQRKVQRYLPLYSVLLFASALPMLMLFATHIAVSHFALVGIFGIFVAAFCLVTVLRHRGNRRLYRMVREYYAANGGRVSRQRAHIKSVAQKLVNSLAVSVRTERLNPEDYKIRLFSKDYSNIKILKQEKASNTEGPIYTAIVKARNSSQE